MAIEEYRSLAVAIGEELRDGEGSGAAVVLVTGAEPRCGKTLTSLNLALTFAETGDDRVVLVEGDLRRPSLSEHLDIDVSRPGFSDVLRQESSVGEAIHSLEIEADVRLDFLPVGDGGERDGPVAGARVAAVVGALRLSHDVVIIDSAPAVAASSRVLANLADGILFVVRAGHSDRRSVEIALALLEPKKVLGMVLNDARRAPAGYYAGRLY